MKKHTLRLEARQMREKGNSYKQIAEKLGVAKSTAYKWTSDVVLNENALKVVLQREKDARVRSGYTRYLSKQQTLGIIKQQQREYLLNIPDNSSRLLCALIYWCEGAKRDTSLAFTNSDPALISTFLNLLRKSFPLDEKKLRVYMHLHDYHVESVQKAFWSKVTHIPEAQFGKTYLKAHSGNIKRKGYQGCISLRYYDSMVSRSLLLLAHLYMHKQ